MLVQIKKKNLKQKSVQRVQVYQNQESKKRLTYQNQHSNNKWRKQYKKSNLMEKRGSTKWKRCRKEYAFIQTFYKRMKRQ